MKEEEAMVAVMVAAKVVAVEVVVTAAATAEEATGDLKAVGSRKDPSHQRKRLDKISASGRSAPGS